MTAPAHPSAPGHPSVPGPSPSVPIGASVSSAAPILHPYQRRYLLDASRFKAGMWSRQTGKTFTTTLEAVLDCLDGETSGAVRKWTILSISQARAKDALDDGVKLHLRAMRTAFEEAQYAFKSEETAFEVRLPGGSRIRSVAANPETARGMSDNLILDEFGRHKNNRAIWAALFPVISRPDLKLRVISTPNGKGDKFHEIMTDPELGQLFRRHVVTIHDAVADGLPRNVEELRRGMSDPAAWAQEFECRFVDEAHAWLPYELIDACIDEAAGDPAAYKGGPCWIGMDIAARGDLTVIAVLEDVSGVLVLRELVEMRNVSFAEQLAALDRVLRDYRAVRVAMDQTGLGEMPVQEARRRHGTYRIEGVIFTAARKLDMATALKTRMEDRNLSIPPGQTLRHDLHSVRRSAGTTGAPRLTADRSDIGHADRFWALALACAAAAEPYAPIAFDPAPPRAARWDAGPDFDPDPDADFRPKGRWQ